MADDTATATIPKPSANGKPKKADKPAPKKEGKKPAPKPAAKKPEKADPKKPAAPAVKAPAVRFVKAVTGAGSLESLDPESLVFDGRLQHRSKLIDTQTVEAYAEAGSEGATFPPLKVIREKGAGKDKAETLYVFDGFQRGAAYKHRGVKRVPCEVWEGTFEDAFILSLKSNSDNSVLPRTGDDKMRSVVALIENKDALSVVMAQAAKMGGGTKAIAAACGCSAAWVHEALDRRGLKVSGDKVVKKPAPKPAAEAGSVVAGDVEAAPAVADATLTAGAIVPAEPEPVAAVQPVTPEQQKAANLAAFAAQKSRAYIDRVKEGLSLVKRLGVILATLATDEANGEEVVNLLAMYDIGIAGEFSVKAKEQGDQFEGYFEIIEHWPVAEKLTSVLNLLRRRATPDAE